jgi:TatD DNase family protein
MLIDSHCHLTFPELSEQIDAVLDRADAAGVKRIVNICTSSSDAERAVELLGAREQVSFSVGLHPHDAKNGVEELPAIRRLVAGSSPFPRLVAIGETGLDYHYDFSPREQQITAFRAQLELASELNLPVVIHARAAEAEACEILNEYPALAGRAVFHCYSGPVEVARQILDAGYWISFTGIVTFKKSTEIQDVARLVPLERIMVETDAPYLSPEPKRSVRPNEPAFVTYTNEFLAKLLGSSVEEMAELTMGNARRFFSLPD